MTSFPAHACAGIIATGKRRRKRPVKRPKRCPARDGRASCPRLAESIGKKRPSRAPRVGRLPQKVALRSNRHTADPPHSCRRPRGTDGYIGNFSDRPYARTIGAGERRRKRRAKRPNLDMAKSPNQAVGIFGETARSTGAKSTTVQRRASRSLCRRPLRPLRSTEEAR